MGYMHRPLPLKAEIDGIKIEYLEIGEGRPLLYLHPVDGVHEQLPFLQRLKSKFRVIAPSHPGFGASELPGRFSAVDDLAYFYLDLMDAMNNFTSRFAQALLGATRQEVLARPEQPKKTGA